MRIEALNPKTGIMNDRFFDGLRLSEERLRLGDFKPLNFDNSDLERAIERIRFSGLPIQNLFPLCHYHELNTSNYNFCTPYP